MAVPFLYQAKPSTAEKEAGLSGLIDSTLHRVNPGGIEADPRWAPVVRKNVHPTPKGIALMRWLTRLVTPPGGLVLDPFTGSGTTGCAAMVEGFRFVGIEMSEEYHRIATARITHWRDNPNDGKPPKKKAEQLPGQLSLFEPKEGKR